MYLCRWGIFYVCLCIAGCVSHEYKEIVRHDGATPPYNFSVGDVVSVTTNDEQSLEFKITEISKTSIRGKDIEVTYDDIRAARIKQVDGIKTIDNTANILLAIQIVVGVAVAVAISP
jgi:protein involved in polysaccharide export with SLBB domain